MKKEHFIILTLVLIIFIAGCTSFNSSIGSGPNGVNINFIQPENIVSTTGIDETSSVPIEIELTNKAECKTTGTLCVKDTLSDVYGGTPEQCMDFSLEEARINNKKLELDKQNFIFSSQPYSNLFKDQETNLQATVKYSCDIISGPRRLCVQSPYAKEETNCKNFETISGNNLGSKVSPINVASITKQLLLGSSNELKLKTIITLKKMSKGKIVSQGQGLDYSDYKIKGSPIRVEIDYAGMVMDCNGRDYNEGLLYWKSTDTEKIINCEILLNSMDFQENPLNIHLTYEYEISEYKLIKIKHIES